MASKYFRGSYKELRTWIRYKAPSLVPYDAFLIRILNLKRNELVLDDGAGNGRFSLSMAKYGAQVIALDINKTMIENLKTDGDSWGVEPVIGDCQKLPFRSGVFSKILCVHNLCYVPNYDVSVKEMFRTARVGCVIVIDHFNLLHPSVILAFFISRFLYALKRRRCPVFHRTLNQLTKPFKPHPSKSFSIVHLPPLQLLIDFIRKRPTGYRFRVIEGKHCLAHRLVIKSLKTEH